VSGFDQHYAIGQGAGIFPHRPLEISSQQNHSAAIVTQLCPTSSSETEIPGFAVSSPREFSVAE
jgi:hypothetical protein